MLRDLAGYILIVSILFLGMYSLGMIANERYRQISIVCQEGC